MTPAHGQPTWVPVDYEPYLHLVTGPGDTPAPSTLGLPPNGTLTLRIMSDKAMTTPFEWFRDGDPVPGTRTALLVTEPGTYFVRAQYGSLVWDSNLPGWVGAGDVDVASQAVTVVATDSPTGEVLTSAVTTTAATAGLQTPADLDRLPIGGKQEQTAWLDGLGRPQQTVRAEAAPDRRDAQDFAVYDPDGGSARQYLPYARRRDESPYRPWRDLPAEQRAFYAGGAPKVAEGAAPFALNTAEQSPLYRPLAAWRVGDDAHPRRVAYELNAAADAVRRLSWDGTRLDGSASYAANELTKLVTTDEDSRTVVSFQDERGLPVLQRKADAQTGDRLDTYTLYDDLGRAVLIVPPAAVAELSAANWGASTADPAFLDRWAYRYAYDARGRLTSRQFPGAERVEFVYDRFDRPVLTQDGNRRQASQWYYTKYDAQGRPAVEGVLLNDGSTRADWQHDADTGAYADYETRAAGGPGGEYTNVAFPNDDSGERLSVTRYDDYDLNGDGTPDIHYRSQGLGAALEPRPAPAATGRVTVVRKRVVHNEDPTRFAGDWLTTATLYDQYGNPIQTQGNGLPDDPHQLPNTTTLVYAQGGFVPQVTQSIRDVAPAGLEPTTVRNRYAYDHAGRLLRAWQQNTRNDQQPDPEVLVAAYAYNALGQLVEKNLHSQDGGASFLQSVDLRYTLAGELRSLNNSTLTADGDTNDDLDDVFGFVLHRQEGGAQVPFATTPRHDGGIAAVRWQVRNANAYQQNQRQRERGYAFGYDGFGRLLNATSRTYAPATGAFTAEPNGYNEGGAAYDPNGNLLRLRRNAQPGGTPAADAAPRNTDRLAYGYDGNRLRSVDDNASSPGGFRDGNATGDDYAYDPNGNVVADQNKGLKYAFNVLNKVARQTNTATGGTTAYAYDAAGTVLGRTVHDPRTGQTTEYYTVAGVEYETGPRRKGLASVPTPEGRTVLVTGTPPPLDVAAVVGEITPAPAEPVKADDDEAAPPLRFVYEYHLRDHQGNLRVAFRAETGQRTLRLTLEPPGKRGPQEEGPYPRFRNVASTRTPDAGAYEGAYAAAVAAGQPGPATTLPVATGDVVKLDLWYRTPTGAVPPPPGPGTPFPTPNKIRLLPALLPAPAGAGERPEGTPAPAVAVGLQVQLAPAWGPGRAARQRRQLAQARAQAAAAAPPLRPVLNPAYVLWTLTDAAGNTLQTAGTPLAPTPASAAGWESLRVPFAVQEADAAFLRVQLLSPDDAPTYVDSLTLRHPVPALFISQEQHYYPFGLPLAGAAVTTAPAEAISKAQYNGGSLLEDDLLDAESANYATPYRRYDPAIGRLLGTDPLADQYADLSPGQFAGNDPVNANDPTGAFLSDGDGRGQNWLVGGGSSVKYQWQGSGGGGGGGTPWWMGRGFGLSAVPGLPLPSVWNAPLTGQQRADTYFDGGGLVGAERPFDPRQGRGAGYWTSKGTGTSDTEAEVTTTFHPLPGGQGSPYSSPLNGADTGGTVLGSLVDLEGIAVNRMVDAGQWVAKGKTYSAAFKGNQYVSKPLHVARFSKYVSTVKTLGTGLMVVGIAVSVLQYANGDISGPRATANIAMGLVGSRLPYVGIGYSILEAAGGDQIEDLLWDGRPKPTN